MYQIHIRVYLYDGVKSCATNALQCALYLHGRVSGVPDQTCDLSPQLHQLLQSRSPLGLEAIDAVALMDRFDSKYVVPVAWLENLVQELDEHRFFPSKTTSPRSTTTSTSTRRKDLVWRTTPVAKTSGYKVRIRHYANTDVAFLEVKLRDVHSKTFKHRIVRNGATMERALIR